MIVRNFNVTRYDADEGKVFDYKEPRYIEVFADGVSQGERQEHLNAKTLYLGLYDSITNYVEVDAEGNVTELTEPEIATNVDYEKALSELGV